MAGFSIIVFFLLFVLLFPIFAQLYIGVYHEHT